ncbi:hypothetical protein MASR1M45_16620 [Candidatus Kapaibacterium sp.]
MRKTILIFIMALISISFLLFAQKNKDQKAKKTDKKKVEINKSNTKTGKARLDSLLREFNYWKNQIKITTGYSEIPFIADTNYIDLLNRLSHEFLNKDSLKNIDFANKALEYSKLINYTRGEGIAYNQLGNHYNKYKYFEQSEHYYKLTFEKSKEVNNWEYMGVAVMNMGWQFSNLRKYDSALIKYNEALTYYDKGKVPLSRYNAIFNLKKNALRNQGKINESIHNFEQMLSFAQYNGDADFYYSALNDYAAFYSDLGDKIKATELMKEAYEFAKLKDMKDVELLSLTNLASMYVANGTIKEAVDYNDKALKLSINKNDTEFRGIIFRNLGIVHLMKAENKLADSLFNLSKEHSKKYRTLDNYIIDIMLIGLKYWENDEADIALEYYLEAEKEAVKLPFGTSSEGMLNYNMSLIYQKKGLYSKSLEYAVKNLKRAEKQKDSLDIALSYSSIASIYYNLKELDKAIDYLNESINIYKKYKINNRLALSYYNISLFYKGKNEIDKSIAALHESLKYAELNKDFSTIILVQGTLADLELSNSKIKDYDKAIKSRLRNVQIFDSLGERSSLAYEYYKIGYYFHEQYADTTINDSVKITEFLKSGYDYKEKALNLYKKTKNHQKIVSLLKELSYISQEMNEPKRALDYYIEYSELKDSLQKIDNQKELADLKSKRELEVKEKENQLLFQKSELQNLELLRQKQGIALLGKEKEIQKLALDNEIKEKNDKEQKLKLAEQDRIIKEGIIKSLDREKDLQNAQLTTQKFQRNFFLLGIIILLILIILAYIRSREKKKLIEKLSIQNNEIESQKSLLEEKNTEIVDSINYAATIQNALLPWSSVLNNSFKDHFVIYKPKDIVSGDSYWFQEVDGIKFLAVIDCTGHGVPGSMLTVIANSVLDDAVLSKKLTSTSEILTYMNGKVTEVLNQRLVENSIRDGMEVALLSIQKGSIQFSGAGRPLYLKNGTMEIIKTDKRGIAGQNDNDNYNYSSVEIKKSDNLILYLSSDGYADQMNENSKKYSTKRFVELLDKISSKPFNEQQVMLDYEFETHRGSREQIDDITIVGVRI